MAPRTYSQTQRADSAARTRNAIIEASTALFVERGIPRTSLHAVAERAGVSRGTVLHHFGSMDGLVEAVARHVLARLDVPDEHAFAGYEDDNARVRAFVAAMVDLFRRSSAWWRVFVDEMERPALEEIAAEYAAAMSRLQQKALGQVAAADARTNALVSALLAPGTLGSVLWQLELAGMTEDESSAAVADLVIASVGLASGTPGEGEEEAHI